MRRSLQHALQRLRLQSLGEGTALSQWRGYARLPWEEAAAKQPARFPVRRVQPPAPGSAAAAAEAAAAAAAAAPAEAAGASSTAEAAAAAAGPAPGSREAIVGETQRESARVGERGRPALVCP